MEKPFQFHGGAGSYLGTVILAWLITVITLGLGFPWALCMMQSWKIDNITFKGRKLQFKGTGFKLIGLWIKMWFFCIITLGIYSFWIVPRIERWIWNNTTVMGE